jgi:hypothetical protein
MDNSNFLEWFHGWNSHMTLLETSETLYALVPPNQCDWMYTIEKLKDNKWRVNGRKDDYYSSPEEIKKIYTYIKNEWIEYNEERPKRYAK